MLSFAYLPERFAREIHQIYIYARKILWQKDSSPERFFASWDASLKSVCYMLANWSEETIVSRLRSHMLLGNKMTYSTLFPILEKSLILPPLIVDVIYEWSLSRD